MTDPEQRSPLDGLVEAAAKLLDSLGLNGTRLRWRWNQRRRELAERRARAQTMLRSARTKHKMCRSCRALVPKNAARCEECGTDLSGVAAPGFGRVLSQIFPGVTAATSLLMLVNGFWFVLMLMAQIKTGRGVGLFTAFGMDVLLRFGSSVGLATLTDNWWRLATPIFLHGGLLHFGFNSYALLYLGPLSEAEYGRERFWVIYLVAGIAGNVLASIFSPRSPVVGASGAIFGLLGLLLIHASRSKTVAGRARKRFFVQWTIFLFVFSLLPGISLAAHAGGFLAGVAAGLLVPHGPLRSRTALRVWETAAIVGVLVVLYSFYQVALQARTF